VGLMAGVLVTLGRGALVSLPAWGVLLVALVLLLRFRLNSAWIVLGAALSGLLLFR